MEKTIKIPDIGGSENVPVIEVNVNLGDKINVDDTILVLESDKASMDIPAPFAGEVVKVLVKVGDKLSEGSEIAVLKSEETSNAVVAKPESAAKKPAANQQKTAAPESVPVTVPATDLQQNISTEDLIAARTDNNRDAYAGPSVRRYARELGVDLNAVVGSGRKQRIVTTDVKNHVKTAMQGGATNKANNTQNKGNSNLNIISKPEIDFSKFGEIETKALSRIKKISGDNLHRNWVQIPHVTQFEEADITELEDFRQVNKKIAEAKGFKLTPLVFFMKAVVAALKEFPEFNSSLDSNCENLILKKYYNIGVAVDTPNGLVVPVVNDVSQKSLFELAEELKNISQKAREGKLKPKDMQGGCFTISSLGGIGGTAFTPIINAPEVAILGISKAELKPVYNKEKQLEARLMVPLSLSYDHKVIDGAQAAKFTSFLKAQLSDIRKLLL